METALQLLISSYSQVSQLSPHSHSVCWTLLQVRDYYPFMSAGPPSQLEDVWRERLLCVPEGRDQHGRRIFIMRLGQWDPSTITTTRLFTAAFTLFELIALEEKTQIAGVTVVADISGFGFRHLK